MRGGDEAPGVMWAVTVELVRCVGLIADSIRRGDDVRLARALEKLHALDELAHRMFSTDAALVISLMRQFADRYASASIFNPMLRLAALRPEQIGRASSRARVCQHVQITVVGVSSKKTLQIIIKLIFFTYN